MTQPRFGFSDPRMALAALFLSVGLGLGLLFIGIYLLESYGIFLFLALPFVMGLTSSLFYSSRAKLTPGRFEQVKLGLLSLFVLSLGILAFALEGVICLLMAAPLGIVANLLGVAMGMSKGLRLHNKGKGNSMPLSVLMLAVLPSSLGLDLVQESEFKKPAAPLRAVTTSVEIQAPPSVVWESVIRFPKLPAPTEPLFQLGIAYPTHAEIIGEGVGALRTCHFSTGAFTEPITVWNRPHELAFDVVAQPNPMTELTLWKIHPPHLEGYFVSKRGKFELTALPGGKTRLTGTTWYSQRIYPEFYWSLWTDGIIHSIHERVLGHIQTQAEKAFQPQGELQANG
ncbi:MAG: hypothetical protein IV090_17270 [Candidatus Sericytochromatia bacterium]|nr:hypothetical protein [Candidatus Sericytochromatia bacterium]